MTDQTPPADPGEEEDGPSLIAYEIEPSSGLELVRAPSTRRWMNGTPDRFANRCLPMLLANQAGWFVVSTRAVRLRWDGTDATDGVEVEYVDGSPRYAAMSHFGSGIVTWNFPWLFQTPPGYNLLVRGPSNFFVDGIQALEGLVETDWSLASFTMNWKLTRPDEWITLDEGFPISMIVPLRRYELEQFQPVIRNLGSEPEVAARFTEWRESRATFLERLEQPDTPERKAKWQKHYFQGVNLVGEQAHDHQRKLRLRDFRTS